MIHREQDLLQAHAWGSVVLGISSGGSEGWCLGQDGEGVP